MKFTVKENSVSVDTASTLSDGRRASAINMITMIDENTFTWESTGREVDGEMLPDVDPVKFVRKIKKFQFL